MTIVFDYSNNNLTQQVNEIKRLKDKVYQKQVNYYQLYNKEKETESIKMKNKMGEIHLLEEILDFRIEEYSYSQKKFWETQKNP